MISLTCPHSVCDFFSGSHVQIVLEEPFLTLLIKEHHGGEKISPVFLPGKGSFSHNDVGLVALWERWTSSRRGLSSVVPQQGYAPPGYNPPQPGYEYVPNPRHNIYRPFEENYGGPTYIQRKAQAPYVTEYGEPVLEEWQYSGGYQGALNRGEIHYQPGSGYNTPTPVRGQ